MQVLQEKGQAWVWEAAYVIPGKTLFLSRDSGSLVVISVSVLYFTIKNISKIKLQSKRFTNTAIMYFFMWFIHFPTFIFTPLNQTHYT